MPYTIVVEDRYQLFNIYCLTSCMIPRVNVSYNIVKMYQNILILNLQSGNGL